MTDKQKISIKLAIFIMDKNFNRYHNVTYSEMGEKVSFGEAINILQNMIKEQK